MPSPYLALLSLGLGHKLSGALRRRTFLQNETVYREFLRFTATQGG